MVAKSRQAKSLDEIALLKQTMRDLIALSNASRVDQDTGYRRKAEPFRIPEPMPGVLPKEAAATFAQDSAPLQAMSNWASGYQGYAFSSGLEFLGYPYLSELSQRAEYRRAVEIVAKQMTREWIKFKTKSDGKGERGAKEEKIARIEEKLDHLRVRDAFKAVAENDGFFGRSHLYINTGDEDSPGELKTPLGNGRSDVTKKKITKNHPIIELKPIEPIWTYPTTYNAANPLLSDWYNPQNWYVMGREIHCSRLLTFVGRKVPDLLKPSYSFGGLSLTQIMKETVDNWLRTRRSVSDIISSFTQFVLKLNMTQATQVGGQELLGLRVALFNNFRNNLGVHVVDNETEDFANVSASLASLDLLQAQAQEHMASVCGIPIVFLLGISPAGLNASSEGEIKVFYDWIKSEQEANFRPHLTTIIDMVQLSEFGKVDEDIIFDFKPLWSMDEKALADVEKTKADTAVVLIDSGVIAPDEHRRVLINDPESAYAGLNPDDAPDLLDEEEAGLEIPGARQELQSEEVEGGAKPAKKGKPHAIAA